MEKHKILLTYNEEKIEEKKDIFSIFEDIKNELNSWNIEYNENEKKDKKRGYIGKIDNEKFEITIAPINDMIELDQANTIYANNSEKKVLGKDKTKYFDYGLQVLVDIVLEAKKEVENKK